jgi:hypothetical protein
MAVAGRAFLFAAAGTSGVVAAACGALATAVEGILGWVGLAFQAVAERHHKAPQG